MEKDIVFVRLRSGETHPASRANLAKTLRVVQSCCLLIFGEKPGTPSAFLGQSPETYAAEVTTREFEAHRPHHQ